MSAPAAAAPKRITGQLSQSGYTVIAIAANGEAKVVRARRGRFRLRPPADSVTLQLRAPNGKYAGPIVIGGRGSRVIVGVRAGARLGKVRVRGGYARVARRLRRQWLDTTRTARARHGVPLGAGNYGRVRSRPLRASAAARRGAGGDRDSDGIPDELDVSDDGDLILDNFDRPRRARAAQVGDQPGGPLYLGAQLGLLLEQTVNVNARPGSSLTVSEVDAALKPYGRLDMDTVPRAPTELDCGAPQSRTDPTLGGLVYCTRGGTGTAGGVPFPGPPVGKFDPDRNGMGAIGSNTCPIGEDCTVGFQFQHGATTAQIGTGDVLIERAASTGEAYSGTLQFVFATVLALVSYRDTAGNSATVSYPVPPPGSDCSRPGCPGGLGTDGNGFPVAPPAPNGDIVVTLTFWRPQRAPAPGDACLGATPPCAWLDIGGLSYHVALGYGGGPECPQSAYSTPSGSELTPITLADGQGALADSALDRAASSQNSFTFTLNLSECLRNPRGFMAPTNPLPWRRGDERTITFLASNDNDLASQIVFFKRTG